MSSRSERIDEELTYKERDRVAAEGEGLRRSVGQDKLWSSLEGFRTRSKRSTQCVKSGNELK